jgi:4-hydroxy-tetrahydrodipicolinate reductase
MGKTIADAVSKQEDMELVGGVDVVAAEEDVITDERGNLISDAVFSDLDTALETAKPDVVVDFTHPTAVAGNIKKILAHGVDCVVGTTGLTKEDLAELAKGAKVGSNATLFHTPNFTTGAVLMMLFAKQAAKFFPDAEVIEFHHNGKADSPSGTATTTARIIAEARDFGAVSPGKETELSGYEGARGALASGVPVHSVRSDGYVAHQEVIFGSAGQTLTIRHDSIDRKSYMPGIMLAIRNVGARSGLVFGLETFMED